ncbi:uncharacterized protein LOC128198452 [Bicyclus anynana]|uniref:Uncharacterized protein LOC128198452 n=1 Tax=Bicyclus anynana TaxID=110368 RepID=A0ABM3LLL3_BICAN|nr:uncharacterized protein LOC128198452 [Bicyclus anynana]
MRKTKKMASNLENTLRRIKDCTQDFGKNIYDHLSVGIKNLANKDAVTEDDIRQYEELVIMKKHPYLDLRALQMKYSPLSSKNIRQSATIPMDRDLQNQPGIHCDTVEDLLNVEIINRGLSGVSIPPQLVKHTNSDDIPLINNNVVRKTNKADDDNTLPITHPDQSILKSLKEEINAYMDRKSLHYA